MKKTKPFNKHGQSVFPPKPPTEKEADHVRYTCHTDIAIVFTFHRDGNLGAAISGINDHSLQVAAKMANAGGGTMLAEFRRIIAELRKSQVIIPTESEWQNTLKAFTLGQQIKRGNGGNNVSTS